MLVENYLCEKIIKTGSTEMNPVKCKQRKLTIRIAVCSCEQVNEKENMFSVPRSIGSKWIGW
jgi:hypothetical protein